MEICAGGTFSIVDFDDFTIGVDISRRTVYRYGRNGKEEAMYGPRRPQPSKLDRFKPYLRGRLRHFPDLTARRLLQEIQDLSYEGQYTLLKNYLRTIRPKPVAAMEVRYETHPGDQAQVDFGDFRTPFGRVFALVVTLSWSRLLWVGWSCQSDRLTLMGMLHCAFLFFGGVPRRLLFDRMKTVVAASDREGGAVFNAEFLHFCRHYGFRPQTCHPCRPQTKGKVERAISYLTFPVSGRNRAEILPLLLGHTHPGSLYYTDDWHAYTSLSVRGNHVVISKMKGQPKGRDHINGIEGFWSYAKHWLYQYRGVPRTTFHLYLKEIEFRFNHRDENLIPYIMKLLSRCTR